MSSGAQQQVWEGVCDALRGESECSQLLPVPSNPGSCCSCHLNGTFLRVALGLPWLPQPRVHQRGFAELSSVALIFLSFLIVLYFCNGVFTDFYVNYVYFWNRISFVIIPFPKEELDDGL